MTILRAKIFAGMTGEEGPDFEDGALPPSYENAMEPYVKKGPKARQEICRNLSSMIGASFIPEGLSYWEQLFPSPEDVEAVSVSLIDFAFDGTTNLPQVIAEAVFDVSLKSSVTPALLAKLQEDGESLGEAVNFYWRFVDNPIDDWDGSLLNHSGIEVQIDL